MVRSTQRRQLGAEATQMHRHRVPEIVLGFLVATSLWTAMLGWDASHQGSHPHHAGNQPAAASSSSPEASRVTDQAIERPDKTEWYYALDDHPILWVVTLVNLACVLLFAGTYYASVSKIGSSLVESQLLSEHLFKGKEKLDDIDLAFWEKNLDRVTSFVTTNGLIQVTLCTAFPAALALLLTFAEPDAARRVYIFKYIIPSLSLVMLSLSANIYAWIFMQLWYLSHFGRHPSFLKVIPSYEQWKELIAHMWRRRPLENRIMTHTLFVLRFYFFMPLRIGNIYCYYFLLYIGSPIVAMLYVSSGFEIVNYLATLIVAQLLICGLSMREVVRLQTVASELQKIIY